MKKKKKIMMIAPRFYGIDEAILLAFKEMGHDTFLKQSRTELSLLEKIAKKAVGSSPFKSLPETLIRHYLARENEEYLKSTKEFKPDLLFVIKGETILPEYLKKLKKMVGAVVCYIWDDPFYSYAGRYSDHYRRTNFERGMALYDHIFVYDRYHAGVIKKAGPKRVDYLPLAASPHIYDKRIELTDEYRKKYGHEICFVGVPYPNRIEVLEAVKDHDLAVYGDGWEEYFERLGKPMPAYYKGKAFGEKVLKIYLASKIVLNIHDPEAKEGLNTRTFDILAGGGFELVDHQKSLDEHFKVGEEIAAYQGSEDLKRNVAFFLQDEAAREQIVDKGKAKVMREHTWLVRAKEVQKILEREGLL